MNRAEFEAASLEAGNLAVLIGNVVMSETCTVNIAASALLAVLGAIMADMDDMAFEAIMPGLGQMVRANRARFQTARKKAMN